ncbi:hypothetical protein [Actinoallomurus iriomotensis]|nr:hypothetical protein [Actinoallomurus iriomotensis]
MVWVLCTDEGREVSFELGVWREDGPVTAEDAGDRYEQVAEQEPPGGEPDQQVAAFHQELTSRFPDLDDLPDEDDSSPWMDYLDLSADGVFMKIAFSRVEEMVPYVIELAAEHGLVCYDPQEHVVHNPPR